MIFAIRNIKYLFTLLNKQSFLKLKKQYQLQPNLNVLKPFLVKQNIAPLFNLVASKKSIPLQNYENNLVALQELAKLETEQQINIAANIKKQLSRINVQKKNYPKAMELAQESLKLIQLMQNPHQIELATLHINLGEIYLLDKNTYEKSFKYLSDGIKILEQYRAQRANQKQEQITNESLVKDILSITFARLSWFYYIKKDLLKAKQYIDKSCKEWSTNEDKYNRKNYEFTIRTKCQIYRHFELLDDVLNESLNMINNTKHIHNKVWFLNLLVKLGYEEHKKQLQECLNEIKSQLKEKEYEIFLKSITVN